ISFYEPWLGGKRPNSFSLSAYYSIQTGLSKRYQNAYNDNINNYYYGSSDYSSYSYSNYDKNIYLRTLGIAATFGQRLNWPDDYFSFYGELSYQRYDCKDWPKAYFGFSTGVSNNLSLGLTLIRNSISNPIYTRRGSSFSVSLHITPPYSAFDGKDYENMASDDPQRYEWIEYHKWKINAKMFIPVTKDEKLVLMARADYGFLGYFNKNKRSPFEKFYVGGDGMSGYTTAGTETIGLRGYEAGALTPISDGVYNGNLYSKLTLELRYPILLKEQTTIWALAFVEAGNCWSEFQDFNPFDLKRSAGAGVRVYLPMFGLLGVDWGWGFDPINGSTSRSGSHFNFILGQEF